MYTRRKRNEKLNCYRPGVQQHLGPKGARFASPLSFFHPPKANLDSERAGGKQKRIEARRESFFFSLLSTSCSSFSFSSSLSSPPPHLGFCFNQLTASLLIVIPYNQQKQSLRVQPPLSFEPKIYTAPLALIHNTLASPNFNLFPVFFNIPNQPSQCSSSRLSLPARLSLPPLLLKEPLSPRSPRI